MNDKITRRIFKYTICENYMKFSRVLNGEQLLFGERKRIPMFRQIKLIAKPK